MKRKEYTKNIGENSMKTQITTGKVRFSYVNVFAPRANNEGVEKYSITLLIPKSDTATLAKIKDAQKAAREKWIGSGKKMGADPKTTLWDGDGVNNSGDAFPVECHGHYVISATSNRKPVIVYADKSPITDETELYSGCYGKAILNFAGYEASGNKGITAFLNGVMKVHDGEPLGGGVVQDSDWDDDEDGEDLTF
jgi:hypothetical protein